MPAAAAPGTSCGIQWVSPATNTAPNSEVPNAPPSDRKKVTAAVPVPIESAGTAFWVARIMICMVMPMPAPRTMTYRLMVRCEVWRPRWERSHMPMITMNEPRIGIGL